MSTNTPLILQKYYPGLMKRTTRNAAKTKQEIIEKSAPIFNVHGFAGTSMQMLVNATGYQMGGIYRHFDTKQDLAKAVFQYNYQVLIRSNFIFPPSSSPKEKLWLIIENYKKMVSQPNIKGGCPILNTATEADDTNEEIWRLAKSFVKELLIIIEDILEEGKNTGRFKPTINSKKEALYLFATFEGAVLMGTLIKSRNVIFDIFDQLTIYLEGNILKK